MMKHMKDGSTLHTASFASLSLILGDSHSPHPGKYGCHVWGREGRTDKAWHAATAQITRTPLAFSSLSFSVSLNSNYTYWGYLKKKAGVPVAPGLCKQYGQLARHSAAASVSVTPTGGYHALLLQVAISATALCICSPHGALMNISQPCPWICI